MTDTHFYCDYSLCIDYSGVSIIYSVIFILKFPFTSIPHTHEIFHQYSIHMLVFIFIYLLLKSNYYCSKVQSINIEKKFTCPWGKQTINSRLSDMIFLAPDMIPFCKAVCNVLKVALYSNLQAVAILHLHERTSAFAKIFRVTLDLISTIKYL